MPSIAALATALADMPPRFHLGATPDPAGRPLGELLADPGRLREWLDADAVRVGARDPQVSASMLVQHVAMVLGGATMAGALLQGTLPIATAHQVIVAPSPSTRWAFSLDTDDLCDGDPVDLLDEWVRVWHDGVLGDLVDAVHHSVRVGRRMLEDNVASAAAANLVFLDWWRPEAGFDALAPRLAALGRTPIGDTVTFSTIRHGDRDGLRSERRSCCLHFRCEPPHWCPTCPKLDDAERERIMRTHLGHLDVVLTARTERTATARH
ncbi:MAG: (2Fe-2S)-binding protein [Acidimicrobiales bacterium]|nr:(2Fe-2S)-binding protein [Acidimicrobiales bacterium]